MTKKKKKSNTLAVAPQQIERRIHFIRDQKVMLDKDLAELYDVTTFNHNKAVKRNIGRFPEDFMFQLTSEEIEPLRFQIGMSNRLAEAGVVPFHTPSLKRAWQCSPVSSEVREPSR